MLQRLAALARRHLLLCPRHVLRRTLCDQSQAVGIDSSQLLRVCTVLYQQRDAPDAHLHSHLQKCEFNLTHEFFLQVCNKFLFSWKPPFRFFKFTQTHHPSFVHTTTTYNKIVDILGKSKTFHLLWETITEMAHKGLVNDRSFQIAVKSLASSREMKKSVEIFHLMDANNFPYSLTTLNRVVESLCGARLVEEAWTIVKKLRQCIRPSEVTYKFLIVGFCRTGNLVQASKIWNVMVEEGFVPEIEACDEMIETFFKNNKGVEAVKLFMSMREKKPDLGLSTYRILITWFCKQEKVEQAFHMFDEMNKFGIAADNCIYAALIFGLGNKGRVKEAYKMLEGVENPDVGVYHGMIKALVNLKRPGEATEVFRRMILRGCEPTMHTYIMLLQGHLGKKGRKGPHASVNFDTVFVGGLVKKGKSLEACKYLERMINRGTEVPRFDFNKFLYLFSDEEGIEMFEEIGKRLREVGLNDLADIFVRYGETMTTRDRRRRRTIEVVPLSSC
ncbi:putative pentatricopeptide repeat-containing protein [Nymphaea thermarum]|nr:putative pentatricopeptide repeat-containing protein [Nymphaea thermarum]